MAYENFRDLTRTTASDKMLRDKAFNIAKNSKYDGCQRGLPSMAYKCFDKKLIGIISRIKNDNMSCQQLAEEFHQPFIKNFNKSTEKYRKEKKKSTITFYRQYLGC